MEPWLLPLLAIAGANILWKFARTACEERHYCGSTEGHGLFAEKAQLYQAFTWA